MDLKQLFRQNRKKIIAVGAALIVITAVTVTFSNALSRQNLKADVLTEPVYKQELRNATRSIWRAIQSVTTGKPITQETAADDNKKSAVPADATVTCKVSKESIPANQPVLYTAETSSKIDSSNLVWVQIGSTDYQRMYSEEEKTATYSLSFEVSGEVIKSKIFWRDHASVIKTVDCPDVTVTEPEKSTQQSAGSHQRENLSMVDEDIPSPEQYDLMFPQNTQTTQESQENNSGVPAATTASDTLRCRIESNQLILSEKTPIRMDCSLYQMAIVTAQIVKGDYLPPNPPLESDVAATVINNKISKPRAFYLLWNGMDQFDQPLEVGDYTFVVSAKLTSASAPDYSIQKFQIILEPPVVTQETQVIEETQQSQESKSETATQENSSEQSGATQEVSSNQSKCPGINYPADIAGHWAESVIKSAYDECIVQGSDAEHFYPDTFLPRAEAVKIAMLAGGIKPNTGCYDADCGTPFTDLEMWQGPWIRASYDAKIIKGLSENQFFPNNTITRAESAALTAKAFGIPPHQGCYTANCGAGQPDNLFEDIYLFWQGPWIRALSDRQLIDGVKPHQFMPDKFITRAEFVKLVMSAKK